MHFISDGLTSASSRHFPGQWCRDVENGFIVIVIVVVVVVVVAVAIAIAIDIAIDIAINGYASAKAAESFIVIMVIKKEEGKYSEN